VFLTANNYNVNILKPDGFIAAFSTSAWSYSYSYTKWEKKRNLDLNKAIEWLSLVNLKSVEDSIKVLNKYSVLFLL